MLTGAPPSDRASVTPSPRRRVWPWAAGSIIIALAVIVGTLVGQRIAAKDRLASQVVPAPTLPPLAVSAIINAPGQIAYLALDAHAHTLVAQALLCNAPTSQATNPGRTSPTCGSTASPVVSIGFYDSATGALRNQQQDTVTGPGGPFTLTDAARGVTYFLASGNVTIFSDATGEQIGEYASGAAASAVAAGIDTQTGVIYTLDSKGVLSAFAATDGQTITTVTLPPISQLPPEATPQIVVDASAGRVYVFVGGHNQPEPLFAYNAADLTPLGSWRVQQNTELGPFDAATDTLYLREAPGTIVRLNLATLAANGANGAGELLTPQRDAALSGATVTRFGSDSATGALLVMNSAGVEAIASGATQPYAQLPLVQAPTVFAADTSPWLLPIDSSAGLAYLPGQDYTILIANLARPTSHTAPNALTAALIARAAMAKLLPDTNQNPPFVSAQTFPLSADTVTRFYYIHYSDLGWKGPYTGNASISDLKAGATTGDYTMTLAITWNQLFLHQHIWTVEVTADGRTHLLADSGDGLP